MPVYISLLRGINVGGRRLIKMAELRALYEALGFGQARTLLQSGNVIFRSEDEEASQIVQRIEAGIQERFGFDVAVMLRSADELAHAIDAAPFPQVQKDDPKKLLVMFLRQAPRPEAIAALHEQYNGVEAIVVQGRAAYLYYVHGIGRSKLTAAVLEKHLQTVGTARNWNTVMKLRALAAEFAD